MTETPTSSAHPLSGAELLARFQSLQSSGLKHNDIAVECGYYGTVASGRNAGAVRANTAAFNQALLAAQGLYAEPKGGGGQRSSNNRAVVNTFGRATLSVGMLERLGAVPGDYLLMELWEENGQKGMKLILSPQEKSAAAETPAATAAEAPAAAPTREQMEAFPGEVPGAQVPGAPVPDTVPALQQPVAV